MKHNTVEFWLHRVLQEKAQDTIEIQKQISTLSYQVGSYNSMDTVYKKEVLENLLVILGDYGWKDAISQMEDKLKQLEEL